MKNITIAAANVTQLDDFIESGFLEKVSKKFNINFLIFKLGKDNHIRIKKLEQYGKIFESEASKEKGIFRKIFNFFKIKINLICYFTNEINQNKSRFNKNFVLNKTLSIDGPNYLIFFKILNYLKLLKIIEIIFKFFLRMFPYNHIKNIKDIDLLLLAYKVFDPTTFGDDLIRVAKKKKIKVFGIQVNWDSLTDRVALETPDFLGVYGEQSFLFATLVQKVPPYRIFPVGSLKFDKYRENNISKNEARKNLNLPIDKKIICICPSGEEFDEIFTLKILNEAVKKNFFSKNICFYFKGYKGGKKKTLENNFRVEYAKEPENLELENIIFWEPTKLNLNNKDYFKNFFRAIDGIISTFSTMSLEAAYNHIPSVGLSYNSKDYGLKVRDNWIFRNHNYHHYPFRSHQDTILCNSREEILTSVKKLIELTEEKKVLEDLPKLVYSCIYSDRHSSSEKVIIAIDDIFKKGRKDDSKIGYK